jgi:hypothetical protein
MGFTKVLKITWINWVISYRTMLVKLL